MKRARRACGVSGTYANVAGMETETPTSPAPPALIGTRQAAELLAVHPATVRKMVESGTLRGIRVGTGHIKLNRADVLAILEPLAGGAS